MAIGGLPRWRFGRMTPAEINQDPVQGEFFSREADFARAHGARSHSELAGREAW